MHKPDIAQSVKRVLLFRDGGNPRRRSRTEMGSAWGRRDT